MPTNLMLVDSQFPRLDQGENTQESITKLQNYLYMLVEQLRYSLHNLDLSNLNQTAWDEMKLEIRKPIYVALENSTGGSAELEATVAGLKTTVEQQGQSITEFQQTANALQISVKSLQTGLSNTVYVDSSGLVISNQDQKEVRISGGAILADTKISSPVVILNTSLDYPEETTKGAIHFAPGTNGYPIGSIYYSHKATPGTYESTHNLWITTNSNMGSIKIRSGHRLSLEAQSGMYINSGTFYDGGNLRGVVFNCPVHFNTPPTGVTATAVFG